MIRKGEKKRRRESPTIQQIDRKVTHELHAEEVSSRTPRQSRIELSEMRGKVLALKKGVIGNSMLKRKEMEVRSRTHKITGQEGDK